MTLMFEHIPESGRLPLLRSVVLMIHPDVGAVLLLQDVIVLGVGVSLRVLSGVLLVGAVEMISELTSGVTSVLRLGARVPYGAVRVFTLHPGPRGGQRVICSSSLGQLPPPLGPGGQIVCLITLLPPLTLNGHTPLSPTLPSIAVVSNRSGAHIWGLFGFQPHFPREMFRRLRSFSGTCARVSVVSDSPGVNRRSDLLVDRVLFEAAATLLNIMMTLSSVKL